MLEERDREATGRSGEELEEAVERLPRKLRLRVLEVGGEAGGQEEREVCSLVVYLERDEPSVLELVKAHGNVLDGEPMKVSAGFFKPLQEALGAVRGRYER